VLQLKKIRRFWKWGRWQGATAASKRSKPKQSNCLVLLSPFLPWVCVCVCSSCRGCVCVLNTHTHPRQDRGKKHRVLHGLHQLWVATLATSSSLQTWQQNKAIHTQHTWWMVAHNASQLTNQPPLLVTRKRNSFFQKKIWLKIRNSKKIQPAKSIRWCSASNPSSSLDPVN